MSYPLGEDETINSMADKIGRWAQDKGFREDWEMADKLEVVANGILGQEPVYHLGNIELGDLLRDAAGKLRNAVVGTKLALIHSEVSEALETLRDTGVTGIHNGEGNFVEELADMEIRIKELAHLLGLDLGREEVAKMSRNHQRPHKHGRQM